MTMEDCIVNTLITERLDEVESVNGAPDANSSMSLMKTLKSPKRIRTPHNLFLNN